MEPELDFNNYRINNNYYNNQIVDILDSINFRLEMIANKFIDYKNNEDKEKFMSDIGNLFLLIKIELEIIKNDLKNKIL